MRIDTRRDVPASQAMGPDKTTGLSRSPTSGNVHSLLSIRVPLGDVEISNEKIRVSLSPGREPFPRILWSDEAE